MAMGPRLEASGLGVHLPCFHRHSLPVEPHRRPGTRYIQRRVLTTNGAVTFIGNALGLNKDGTNDRPGVSGSLGTFITTDTSLRDNPEWPQGTTGDWRLNSSSAVLSLPAGSRIIHAELIWGGSYLFGSEDVSDFLNDPINFRTPTGITQVTRDPATAVTGSGRGLRERGSA